MADSQRKTANISQTYISGYYVNNGDGDARSNTNAAMTDYIDIIGNTSYYITPIPSGNWGAWYDSEKTYISGISGYGVKTSPNNAKYCRLTVNYNNNNPNYAENFMVAQSDHEIPYEPYGWVHSLRKLTTATEAVENPLYADGTAITAYTIKGNTVQSGTPTPSNPVEVQGVGNKTANLLEYKRAGYNLGTNGYLVQTNDYDMWFAPVTAGQTYVAQNVSGTYGFYTSKPPERDPVTYDGSRVTFSGTQPVITVPQGVSYIGIRTVAGTTNAMLNEGSTVEPYEPYGYKIPILTSQGTATVYLNEPLYKIGDYADTISADGTITRRIATHTFTGADSESWSKYNATNLLQFYTTNSNLGGVSSSSGTPTYLYASVYSNIAPYGMIVQTRENGDLGGYLVNGGDDVGFQVYSNTSDFPDLTSWKTYLSANPVTIYYILKTPTTETVTAPPIPTTDGANSITVDTTVQPSEFSATWTGWHDSSVKEYDGTDWQ